MLKANQDENKSDCLFIKTVKRKIEIFFFFSHTLGTYINVARVMRLLDKFYIRVVVFTICVKHSLCQKRFTQSLIRMFPHLKCLQLQQRTVQHKANVTTKKRILNVLFF